MPCHPSEFASNNHAAETETHVFRHYVDCYSIFSPDHVLAQIPSTRTQLCDCASIFRSLVTVEKREIDWQWFIWTGLPRF